MTVLQNFVLEHIDSTAKIIKAAITTQDLNRGFIAKMEKDPETIPSHLNMGYAALNDAETISDRLSDCLELLMCSYLEVYGTREFVKPIADTGILTEDQINEICDDIDGALQEAK